MRDQGECITGIKLLQRLAFLSPPSLRLCPVFFNDKMILSGDEPAAGKVTIMLAGPNLP